MRTTLGVNWELEGVAAVADDYDDDANSFEAVFILQPMKPRYIGRPSRCIVKDCRYPCCSRLEIAL